MKKVLLISIPLIALLIINCSNNNNQNAVARLIGDNTDSSPSVAFTQVATSVGLTRSNEPASANSCAQPTQGTLAYGTWLADFDGDGLLDVYDVNHGQACHRSGLWINNGNGGFGQNLFTVAVKSAPTHGGNLGLSNEMMFVGDMTGDGKVDMYFLNWSGGGVMCVNQGNATHSDWTGPSFLCYSAWEPKAFGDVNNDGKIDVLTISTTTGYDTYKADYAHTSAMVWRLNNGNPDINTWPTNNSFASLRPTDPNVWQDPVFTDLNNDGIPDKIIGIETSNRGAFSTQTAGQQVSLGQTDNTYVLQTNTGLEAVLGPVIKVEDVNEDGCLDVGTDITGYKDNQSWYIQNKTGSTCNVTFTPIARTALPYHPGARRYTVDIDNSGLLSKISLNHNGWGNSDNVPAGLNIWRKLPNGTYTNIPQSVSGVNILGTQGYEFYADQVNPGDWNNDGKIDLAGAGQSTITGTDQGAALWSSQLNTSNGWVKVKAPAITGFFTGVAKIEIFDPGFNDTAHLVTPPLLLYPGRAWSSQIYHFGIGQRNTVDIRVTFPGGVQTTIAGVVHNTITTITPNQAPVAISSLSATEVNTGIGVDCFGNSSYDPDGSIALWTWDFGDGSALAYAPVVSHVWTLPGIYTVTLTITDNLGATNSTSKQLVVTEVDTIAPEVSIQSLQVVPMVSDNVVVTLVNWSFDGNLAFIATNSPFTYTINFNDIAIGEHRVDASACDHAGNCSLVTSFSFNK